LFFAHLHPDTAIPSGTSSFSWF